MRLGIRNKVDMVQIHTGKLSKFTNNPKTGVPLLFAVLICILYVAIAYADGSAQEMLTPAERLWLKKNQSRIVLAVETGYPPFVFLDSKVQPCGLAHDYMLLLESKLGIHFKQRQFSSLDEIFAKVRSGEVHVVNAVTKTPGRSEFLSFTDPFISVPNVIVVREDRSDKMLEKDLAGLKVSLVKNYAITEQLTKSGLGMATDFVPDDLSAILNVSFGRSDAAVIDLATATYLIQMKCITNLRVAGEASSNIELSFGVPHSEVLLRSILQKGLNAITEAERNNIHERWIYASHKSIFTDRRFWIAATIVVIAVFGVITGIILWNRTLRRLVAIRTEDLAKEKKTLQLSEEHHRTILQTAMDGFWRVDLQGRLLEVNKAYCRMSGYSEQELLTMSISDLEVNETVEDTAAHIQKIMESGEARFESRQRRKDGLVFDAEISVQYRPGGQMVAFLRDITERKHVENSILQAKQDWEQTFDAVPDLISVIATDHTITRVNRAMAQRCGFKPEDLIGRKCYEVMHGTSRPHASCPHSRLKQDSLSHSEEVEEKQLQGVFDVTVSPFYSTEGQLTGCVHVARDITGRKRNELELIEAKNTLLATIDAIPDLLFIIGMDGRYLEFHSPRSDLLTAPVEEFIGKKVSDVLPPEAAAVCVSAIQEASEKGSSFGKQYELHLPQGKLWFELSVSLQLSQPPEESRFIVLSRDITERKQADAAVRESEKRYRDLIENVPAAFYKYSTKQGGMFYSRHVENIFGYSLQAFYDKPLLWTDSIHPDDVRTVEKAIGEIIANGGRGFDIEYRVRTQAGKWIWLRDSSFHTVVSDDEIVIHGFAQNISNFKQAEEEKMKLEAQLHQAQKMEFVGSLAGGVAHDFNNKLSVILGCTYLASAESDPAKLQHFLEEIRKAAEQSADLTRQLLAFARRQTIMPKVLDLNETVTGMLKMLNRLIGENITLTWQPASDLWPIKFDPSQVDQILANLCVNARDSITDGGNITIETGNNTIDEVYCTRNMDAVPGKYVRLAVSDSGCGMNNETQARIFEPFFTTKEEGKGTGLGLATVFGIVKQNKGFINVYSEPGLGTTFTIYLPRYTGASGQAQRKDLTRPSPRGLETILLVEDELAILNITSMILSKQGYSVLQTHTPTEAIHLAKEHIGEIRLLITDVIMPEMNGKDLVHNLRSLNPHLKCLFMSGYTADAISPYGVLDEGENFIQKPFSLPDLANKVREVLDGRS